MTVRPPTTNVSGNDGRCGFRDVDFKTAQDLVVALPKVGKRYRIKAISIISKTIASLSNGATVVVLEASTGSDTDATIVLTSNGTKPANGTTVTLAGKVYTLKDFVQASTTLLSNEVQLNDGDTVTIGNKTYTFKTALTPTEGQVLIGADADASLLNLARAINHTGTPDTDYSCAAAHTQVSSSASVTDHAITITALDAGTAGNSIAVSDTASTRLTFDGDTLAGGTDPTVEGEVKIGLSAATMLDNLKAAVNHDAGHETLYFCEEAHPKVTATTNTDTQQTFVASVGDWSGAAGNGLTGADDSETLSWNQSGIFAGGLDGVLVNELVGSTDLTDTDEDGLVQNLTLASDAEVVTGGNSVILAIRTGSTATTDVKDVDIEYVVI